PDAVIAPSAPAHEAVVWRHLVTSVGASIAPGDALREPIAVPATMLDAGRRALAAAGCKGERRLVMIHPGAGGTTKRWPPARFAALAERLPPNRRAGVAFYPRPAPRHAPSARRAALSEPAARV